MTGRRLYVLGSLVLWSISNMWAASPAIGTATATGKFAVNRTQVSGSATLFDGALVETGMASSQLQLNNGSQIGLNANSRLIVREAEAVLEKGSGEIGLASGFQIQARTLRIDAEAAGAKAEVRLSGDREVLVKAVNGPVRVFSKTGVLVAKVNAGMGVSLDPYAAPPDAFEMTGCLVRTTAQPYKYGFVSNNIRFELTGQNLGAQVGNRVRIVGDRNTAGATLQGATAVVQVTSVQLSDAGGCLAVASSWPGMTAEGGGSVPPPAKTGMSAKSKGIIAGVAIAGAGGGIVAATCCKSK